jgi:GDP-4-dehydro-6-deoxy-D-mannose reductase
LEKDKPRFLCLLPKDFENQKLCQKNIMKVFITGITGMVGSHFANAARARGWETFGVARFSAASRIAAVDDPSVIRCDITDARNLSQVIAKVRPGLVIHMAAQAFNGLSWAMENYTHQANIIGTLNLLQSCRDHVPEAKVLLACSSAAYGNVTREDCPLREDRPLRPITPYGVTKAATEMLGYQYFLNHGLKVYLPRMFIHVGTGHPPATAIQNFARQIALIAAGKLEPVVRVGNLESARDFIDVRDGVEAMMTLLDKGEPGVPINIATGTAHSIRDTLDSLIRASGLNVTIEPDPALFRPTDEPLLLADNSRLRALGWKQRHSFQQTLDAVYADWVARSAA